MTQNQEMQAAIDKTKHAHERLAGLLKGKPDIGAEAKSSFLEDFEDMARKAGLDDIADAVKQAKKPKN